MKLFIVIALHILIYIYVLIEKFSYYRYSLELVQLIDQCREHVSVDLEFGERIIEQFDCRLPQQETYILVIDEATQQYTYIYI